jgi:hypothetical protein
MDGVKPLSWRWPVISFGLLLIWNKQTVAQHGCEPMRRRKSEKRYGPGKPITVEQLHRMLAEGFGIEPTRLPNGEWGYYREQFEAAWSAFLDVEEST